MAGRKASTASPQTATASKVRRRRAVATTPGAEPQTAAPEAIAPHASEGTIDMTKQNGTFDTNLFAPERVQAAFVEANERAKAAVEKGTRLLEEATELAKGNVEAFVASSKVAAKGIEGLGQEAADYGRKSFEEASAALKSFAEAKSPTDFFKLQGDYARAAFDSLVAESSKVSETVIKLAGEVAEPITNRYAVAAERVKTLAL